MVVNEKSPNKKQLAKYGADEQFPVDLNPSRLKKMGLKVLSANLLNKGNLVRHNPRRLAKTIMNLF